MNSKAQTPWGLFIFLGQIDISEYGITGCFRSNVLTKDKYISEGKE